MENFVVSARKYRPDTFETVVGQPNITQTLRNAIKNHHLAHAYLFCGPRGVGKTTCARIFAKSINCLHLTADYEPCNDCESCKAFKDSRSYNIHELDAASNNSVEDIRSLIDQVRIPPQIGSYSVFIIDEVHMLSSAAFNAFLKTLEEPPKHAKFILATTEKHKILPTILSRCQIFDFHRIKVEDIVKHLEKVASSEGIQAEPEGLNVIAHKADGAMRDALSFFDQIVSFAGKDITYSHVIENLNVLDYDYYFRLVDKFIEDDVPGVLLILNNIIDKGFDGHHFIAGLSTHLRDLLVCTDAQTVQLLEVGAGIREKYKKQAATVKMNILIEALRIANHFDTEYRNATHKRLHVELCLIQICKVVRNLLNPPQQQVVVQQVQVQQPVANQVVTTNAVTPQETQNSGGSFSLKNILGNNTPPLTQTPKVNNIVEEPVATFANATNREFTIVQLEQTWRNFSMTQSSRFQSILNSRSPEILPNFQIKFDFDTKISEDTFVKEVKSIMVKYLRDNLQNTNIDIVTNIAAAKAAEKKPTTNIEKYQHLVSLNPNLNKLKDKFNLEFVR